MSPKESMTGRTLGRRYHKSIEIANGLVGYSQLNSMSKIDWLHITQDEYGILEHLLVNLHTHTQETYHDYDGLGNHMPEMIADWEGLKTHIQVMKNLGNIYWQDKSFRDLYPPGTTLQFIDTGAELHDLGRFCGMNAQAELLAADRVSHQLLKTMFPGFPQDQYLHDISYITGELPLPDPNIGNNILIYWMKLIDTCGKNPPRHPNDLYLAGGHYDNWYTKQIQLGSLPITRIYPTAAETYRANDMRFTLLAADLIRNTFPDINFDLALEQAVAELAI